jgi:acyl-CoA thioesterase-2
MSGKPDDPSPVGRLLRLLRLETLDRDLFLADPGPGSRRLFGGLVAAQSYMAAASTLEDPTERPLHSLHAYFLRPGRYEAPIRFVVDRIRDGRSFTTRRVVAHQGGEAIFNLSASFARVEDGPSHQDDAPHSAPPESLPHHRSGGMYGHDPALNPIEMRSNDGALAPGETPPPERIVWMRPRGEVPEDSMLHTALLVFASDRSLVSTAVRPLGEPKDTFRMASLDHALWLHRPVRFEGWLQFTSSSPIAHGARGLIFGSVFDHDGVRIASVAQEGLIRRKRKTTQDVAESRTVRGE